MKNLKRKMNLYLVLLLSLSAALLTVLIILLVRIEKVDLLSIFLIIGAIGMVYLLLKLYDRFDYLKHEYILVSLMTNKQGEIKFNPKKTFNLRDVLKSLDYQHFKSTNDFSIYYKISSGITKKKRNNTLYAVSVFNRNIAFSDDKTTNAFIDLEQSLYKKEKYYNQIFIQLKEKNGKFEEEEKLDADKIFFVTTRKVNVVLLNALYNINNNSAYYLFNSNIKLPYYLNAGYLELEEIFNIKRK